MNWYDKALITVGIAGMLGGCSSKKSDEFTLDYLLMKPHEFRGIVLGTQSPNRPNGPYSQKIPRIHMNYIWVMDAKGHIDGNDNDVRVEFEFRSYILTDGELIFPHKVPIICDRQIAFSYESIEEKDKELHRGDSAVVTWNHGYWRLPVKIVRRGEK